MRKRSDKIKKDQEIEIRRSHPTLQTCQGQNTFPRNAESASEVVALRFRNELEADTAEQRVVGLSFLNWPKSTDRKVGWGESELPAPVKTICRGRDTGSRLVYTLARLSDQSFFLGSTTTRACDSLVSLEEASVLRCSPRGVLLSNPDSLKSAHQTLRYFKNFAILVECQVSIEYRYLP